MHKYHNHYSKLNNFQGSTNVEEITRDKELVKIVDQLGREIKRTKNSPMFYIYNDGTTEKRVVIE